VEKAEERLVGMMEGGWCRRRNDSPTLWALSSMKNLGAGSPVPVDAVRQRLGFELVAAATRI